MTPTARLVLEQIEQSLLTHYGASRDLPDPFARAVADALAAWVIGGRA